MLNGVGLDSTLSTGLYTIFAPSNEALGLAYNDTNLTSTVNITDPGVATRVALQHFLSGSAIMNLGELPCNEDVEMANGDPNTLSCSDDLQYIGGPGNDPRAFPPILNYTGIVGCNFVVYPIDGLIIPS